MFTPPKHAANKMYTFLAIFFLANSDPEDFYVFGMHLSQWLDISSSVHKVAVNKVYTSYN